MVVIDTEGLEKVLSDMGQVFEKHNLTNEDTSLRNANAIANQKKVAENITGKMLKKFMGGMQ